MIYDNDNLACSMTCKKYELIYSKQIFNSHGSRLPYPKAAPGICWLFIKANSAECPGNGHKGPGKWGNRIRRRRERRLRSACCMGNQLNSTRGNSTQLNHNHLGGSSCRACQAEAGKSASAAPQRRGAKKKKKKKRLRLTDFIPSYAFISNSCFILLFWHLHLFLFGFGLRLSLVPALRLLYSIIGFLLGIGHRASVWAALKNIRPLIAFE